MEKSIGSSNGSETSHILGIDFGKAKIGLAIADSETRMAFAFDTLENNNNFIAKLNEIIKKKNVTVIVMGIVRHEKDPKSVKEKMDFAEMIKKETGIFVAFQDEMFTTKLAQENIKKRGDRNISQKDDQEAARIILQEWLDLNN